MDVCRASCDIWHRISRIRDGSNFVCISGSVCDPRIDGTGAFDGDLAECPDSQVIGGSGERAVSILCSFKRRCFLDVFPDLRCCGDGVCICGDRAVLRNDGGRQPDLQAGLERNPSTARWRTAVSDSLWSAFNVFKSRQL